MEKFFYRVQDGDTVLSLATRFNIPPVALIKGNDLKAEIQSGDVLFIVKTDGEVYTAQPFDTIFSVAARFNVPEETLKEENGVDYLFYGLKVIIPK